MTLQEYLDKERISVYAFECLHGFAMSQVRRYLSGCRTPSKRFCEQIEKVTVGQVKKQYVMWPDLIEGEGNE